MRHFSPTMFMFFVLSMIKAQVVSTTAELQTALSNAQAGTIIEITDGTYTDVQININVAGTSSQPCTIMAQNPGAVFFEGKSNISIGGSYIIFEGIVFQNASGLVTSGGKIEPIIEFRDGSNDQCDNCIVRNVKIDSYNGTIAQDEDTFKWIILYGQNNEIAYCSFVGKNGVGSIINDNRNNNDPNYSKIHHNYFAGRIPVDNEVNKFNDQDAIRIGNSSTSLSDSFTEVYENFFYDWAGEVEIISNKSGKNKYYNNTFRDYHGSLTLRHGNGCEVFNNYFFAENNTFTAGVRIIGEDHLVYNNYIEGINHRKPNGSGSNATGGINVSNGRLNTALNGYYQVKNTFVVNNTFVDCDLALRVGTKVKSDLDEEPVNLVVANNIMLNSTDKALQEKTAPSGASSIYQGNITQNGSWDLTNGVNDNQTVNSGLLDAQPEFFRLATASAAINASVGSYPFVTTDVLGGTRSTNLDAGAEEFGAGGSKLPYVIADVGVSIGFGVASNVLGVTDVLPIDNKLQLFPVPADNELNVLSGNGMIGLLKVYDITGKLMFEQNIDKQTASINTTTFAKGIYLLKTEKTASKFMVK